MKTEREEAEEKPFVIRPYLKSELAHKYNAIDLCHAETTGMDQE